VATYTTEYNSYIPRGGDVQHYPAHQHWTLLVLKQHGYRIRGTERTAINRELEKRPVFHCPERKSQASIQPEVVSYVVNAFTGIMADALNTGGGRGEQKQVTRVTDWKYPAQVVYLADFELAEVSPYVRNNGTGANTVNCADVYQAWSLPPAPPTGRRVARAMHSRKNTNCLFVDGHATGVNSLPLAGEPEFEYHHDIGTYSRRWLGLFGVQLPSVQN
jgi:prepilin-type processing-associated H-X9-DG protein